MDRQLVREEKHPRSGSLTWPKTLKALALVCWIGGFMVVLLQTLNLANMVRPAGDDDAYVDRPVNGLRIVMLIALVISAPFLPFVIGVLLWAGSLLLLSIPRLASPVRTASPVQVETPQHEPQGVGPAMNLNRGNKASWSSRTLEATATLLRVAAVLTWVFWFGGRIARWCYLLSMPPGEMKDSLVFGYVHRLGPLGFLMNVFQFSLPTLFAAFILGAALWAASRALSCLRSIQANPPPEIRKANTTKHHPLTRQVRRRTAPDHADRAPRRD